jgi:hypothetical protein
MHSPVSGEKVFGHTTSMNICLIIIILHHGHNYVAAVQILVIFRKNVEVTSLKAISNNTQILAGRLNITGKYCFDSTCSDIQPSIDSDREILIFIKKIKAC